MLVSLSLSVFGLTYKISQFLSLVGRLLKTFLNHAAKVRQVSAISRHCKMEKIKIPRTRVDGMDKTDEIPRRPTAPRSRALFFWKYGEMGMPVMKNEKSLLPLWAKPLINDSVNRY